MDGNKIVILGGGESGVGAALLAKEKGFEVFVSDKGKIPEKFKNELLQNSIPYEERWHTWERIEEADLIIKSPGIPDKVPVVKKLVDMGKSVISEIEFAARYSEGTLIGITGSNGKTTTTLLIGHLLKSAGLDVTVAGNIGKSFARCLTEKNTDYWVLELSSFQLDGIIEFKPDIALLLNITPDHLDRYENEMERYINSKFRITMNQGKKDVFCFNEDDLDVTDYLKDNPSLAIPKGISMEMVNGNKFQVEDSMFDLSGSSLRGIHNAMNAAFATVAAKRCDVKDDEIQKALKTFVPLAHRLESFATIAGVEYVNDSKATNIDAVYYGLHAMEKPVVWIVGGQDKGNDYHRLFDLVEEKVKAIVCMGVDNYKLLDAFMSFGIPMIETRSAEEAVEAATNFAEKGDVVLLSPACASFDLFNNYQDRGNQFRNQVLKLKKRS
jgi:UDP-N-acetylmuramoylalanine--D-glutamate ligase